MTRTAGTAARLTILVLAVASCAAASEEAVAPGTGSTLCVQGRVTDEGVECPTLRAADGTLYALTGDVAGLGSGDEVCVCGSPQAMSFCMQGRTLAVTAVAESCPR